jgi:Chromo (CHRromatin Organisation MOdifier) domain
MQTLAQMLAMVVDSQRQDWHRWLPHVQFAYNCSEHSVTGSSPFLLATGRQPRIALHALLGSLRANAIDMPGRSPVISELVEAMLARQRGAHSLMSRRHALRKAKVLRSNAELATRFGLLSRFVAGDKAWWFHAPRTTSARAPLSRDGALRNIFSKKFQDLWHGPYSILQVGPSDVNGRRVQSNVLLLGITRNGVTTEQRVNASQCKPCLDPQDLLTRPSGFPSGFSKYLLARYHRGVTPSSIALEDVDLFTERHGVEAILDHRIRQPHRGAPQLLEYRVRWEGDECAESWEPSDHLDSCGDTLDEYWRIMDGTQRPLPHQGHELVAERLSRVRSARSAGVQPCALPLGKPYQLPEGALLVTALPPRHQLNSRASIGLGVLQTWKVTSGAHITYCWYEGAITSPPHHRKSHHRVRFLDGKTFDVDFSKCQFTTATDPSQLPESSFSLFGTQEQLLQLAAIEPPAPRSRHRSRR